MFSNSKMDVKKMTHEEYLRKYIIGNEKKKKVKKKKRDNVPSKKPVGMKIIDDDVDIKAIAASNIDVVDECGEDAPTVAEVIDERPVRVQLRDQYKASSWKRVGDDDDEDENDLRGMKDENKRKATASVKTSSSRMRHDSDSDLSPERMSDKPLKSHRNSKTKILNTGDDFSPPRKSNIRSTRRDSDSDLSPIRTADKFLKSSNHRKEKRNSDENLSPPRRHSNFQSTHHDSSSDLSPIRTANKLLKILDSDRDFSPSRYHNGQPTRHDSDSDIPSLNTKSVKSNDKILHHSSRSTSSHRKHDLLKKKNSSKRTNSDSNSSHQKNRHDSDSDLSLPRRASDNDSDISVTRNSRHNDKASSSRRNKDSHRTKRKVSLDRNLSPELSSQRKKYSDHDSSSDYQQKYLKKDSKYYSKGKSQRDISPLSLTERRYAHSSNEPKSFLMERYDDLHHKSKSSSLSKEGENKRPSTTLSGLKAGLQKSSVMREEAEILRKRERKHIAQMDEALSGRNAQTIYRDRETGKKRDLRKEQEKKDEKDKIEAEKQDKYSKWGKGVEQGQQQLKKFEDDAYEMTKPLARYKDDEDLDQELRNKVYQEDPMFEYIQKKKKKIENLPEYPKYSGPPAPPNRFNVQPGYRWDGVDRSNGFEKRFFEKINSTKAKEIESHLWSIQDM